MPLIASRLWGSVGFPLKPRIVIEGGFVNRITPLCRNHMVHCMSDGRAEGQGKQILVTSYAASILDNWLKTFLTSQGMMSEKAYDNGPGRVFSCVQDIERGGSLSIVPDLTKYLKRAYREGPGFASGPGPVIASAMGRDENGPDILLWKYGFNGEYWNLAGNEGIGGVDLSIVDNESIYPGLEFSKLWVKFRMAGSMPASIYCGGDHGVKVGVEAFNPMVIKHLLGF